MSTISDYAPREISAQNRAREKGRVIVMRLAVEGDAPFPLALHPFPSTSFLSSSPLQPPSTFAF